MKTMGDIALGYLNRGWAVIPAQPRGKKPLIRWEKYAHKLPTPEEVREWWEKWPDANIAIVTGKVSGVVAVDIDTDRGGDPRKINDKNPTGLITRTGSGGFHLLYNYPKNADHVHNRVGKDGIDIRGDGGYIIVPPSTHKSGKKYEFVRFDDPAELPGWVLDEPGEKESEHNEHWLSDLLIGVEHGGRNDAATRLAGYYASKDMAKDVTIQLMQDWNAKNKPPLKPSELKTVINSVYKTEFRRKKSQKSGEGKKATNLNFMEFGSYMSKFGAASIKWTIQDWMPEATIAFCISPPGTYKTWTVFDLAVSVAGGYPFLGHFEVNDPGPVLILQQEDFHGQIVERIASIITQRENFDFREDNAGDSENFVCPFAPQLPIFFHPDRLLRFDDEQLMSSLEATVERIRPKLVIIDPLYSAASTDDYMAKTAEQMFPLKAMRDAYGCSFLVVHHTKKKAEGMDREGGWGSQFLNAFLETGWQIRRADAPSAVTIHRHFKIKGEVPALHLTYDISTEEAPYRYEVTVEDADEVAEESSKKKKSDAAIEKAGSDIFEFLKKGPLQLVEVTKKLGVHKSTASRRLNALVKSGALIKTPKGEYSLPDDLPEF